MKILIRSARIIDPSSSFHRKSKDILIEDGIISKIGSELEVDENVKVIEGKNLYVSNGWIDLRVNFCEPGHEYKEDIKSGLKAAAYGGFTGVAISPSTHPPVDNRAAVEFLLSRKQDSPVDIFPIGTVSDNKEGKELAEMYDMHLGGAKAFSDDKQTISSNKLLYKALTYAQGFNALVMDFPMDYQWIDEGQIHEGLTSTNMGLKGIPDVAEAMMVQRDIAMLKYTGGRLHVGPISSNMSVKLIKKAKKDGLMISADVNHHSLFLTDDKLADFDSSFKLMPPLRDEKNRQALINALKDGTIDVISSDHQPEDEDEKKVEFTRSAFGAIGLESVFSIALEAIDDIELVVKKLSGGPRKVLGLERSFIEKGQKANITVFDPKHRWVYDRESIHSKSLNSPYIGKQMKGKSVAVINGDQYFISE